MDDPFFTAGKRAHGAPWGQHSSYVEDVYRTYKPSSIPQRDNKAFQKALEFRAREKHEFEQLRAQRDEYSELLYSGSIRAKELTDSLSSMTEQFSSLKAEHERHLASSTRIRDIDSVSPELGSDIKAVGGKEHRQDVPECAAGAQLREPSVGGQSAEHGTEGRPPPDVDASASGAVCDEPVHEGGE